MRHEYAEKLYIVERDRRGGGAIVPNFKISPRSQTLIRGGEFGNQRGIELSNFAAALLRDNARNVGKLPVDGGPRYSRAADHANCPRRAVIGLDRKSTRLNSSH